MVFQYNNKKNEMGCLMVKSVIDYYSTYDEDGRLFRDYSRQIEWLTTMHYFDAMIPPRL